MVQKRFGLDNIKKIKNHTDIVFGCVLALTYFILAGLAPALYIQKHYSNGSTFISFYAHLFRYGQFFGWIVVLLLIRPVTYLASLPGLKQTKFRLLMLTILIAISFFLVALDFHSQNHAPYEIKPEIHESDRRLKDHFMKESPSREDIEYYQTTMIGLLKERSNWSTARYLHFLAVFIHSFLFILILVVVAALTIQGSSPKVNDSPEFKEAFIYGSIAILIPYLWILMRVAFNHQKKSYFLKQSTNPVVDYAVIALFTIASLLIAVRLLSWFRDNYSIVISLVTISFGGLSAFAVVGEFTLVDMFGKNVGTLPYWTILGALAALSVFVVLARIMKPSQEGRAT